MSGELEGRVALVTGAGRGLGREHALALARAGAKVVVNDVGVELDGSGRSDDPAVAVAAEVAEAGSEAIVNVDSVAEHAGAGRMVRAALDAFGRLDIVVNNASVFHGAFFQRMTEPQWDEQLTVHVKGAYNVCQHAIPAMVDGGYGRIVNTTSQSAFGGLGYTAYATAKAGLIGFTYALAAECWPLGITVNAVAPDAGTPHRLSGQVEWLALATEAGFAVPDLASIQAPPPPEYVPPLFLFLVSPAGGAVSGRVFYAGGGTIGVYPHPALEAEISKPLDDGPWTLDELAEAVPSLLASGSRAPGVGP